MYAQNEVDRAVRMYRDGVKVRVIAETIGTTEATIYKWLAAAGVPRNRPKVGVKGPRKRKVEAQPRRPAVHCEQCGDVTTDYEPRPIDEEETLGMFCPRCR